jgi:protein-disulfide isomerase
MGKARRTRQTREQERRRARTKRLLIATGAAVVVVIALIAVQQLTSGGGSSAPDPANLAGVADVQAEFDGLTEHAGTVGPASAKVTIVEYGDLRCPICKQFDNDVIPRVISDFVRTGKARLQYKTWPILGPNSVVAAHAAYAAQKQNALWPYAALTYLNQGDENDNWFTKALARSLGAGVGLNVAQFDKDFASTAAQTAVDQVSAEAKKLGFPGTPSIRIVGPASSVTVEATYDAIKAGVQKAGGTAG